jgi:hypothetical protein
MEPLKVPDVSITEEIKQAIEVGWSDYLVKMAVLRNNRSIINERDRGLFFTEPRLRNVTGVLVRHRPDFYLLANPFAEALINDPAIISDFSNCKTGWE